MLRSSGIKYFINYSSMISKPKNETAPGKELKILMPKQMLHRLSIALAQAKACNTSENVLYEIQQVIYFLYPTKEITKKVQKNIINSIKL